MTIYDPAPDASWWTAPRRGCAALAIAAALLMLLPPRATQPLKSAIGMLLRPGLLATAAAGQRLDAFCGRVRGVLSRSDEWSQLQSEVEQLRTRNRQLETAAITLHASGASASEPTHDPLLSPRLFEARILGRQAQAFLRQADLLDVGQASGVSVDNLVVDVPALIDLGAPAGVETGSLVVAGRSVWGKVQQAGEHTSHVRRATEAGYRDLVRLGQRQQHTTTLGSRGVLEGTGEPLCRIRLVPVTEAVSVGDHVFTDGDEGLLPQPLLYGEVVRVERAADSTHWEIWMRPALDRCPARVAVLSATIVEGRGTGL